MSANQDAPLTKRQERVASTPPCRRSGSGWTAVALVGAAVVAGVALRAVVSQHFQPASLWGDEADYLMRGLRLARTGALEGIEYRGATGEPPWPPTLSASRPTGYC